MNEQGKYSLFTLSMGIYTALFLLGMCGCLAIYNATVYSKAPFFLVAKQLLWLMIGMGVLYGSSKIPFEWYKVNAGKIAIASLLPLFAVLVMGATKNGMKGWFAFGSVLLQPSEFAKAPFVLYLSKFIIDRKINLKNYFILLIVAALWVIPIALQPDFGTIIVYLSGFLIVYWVGNGKIKYLLASGGGLIPALTYVILKNRYVLKRITGFINPEQDPFGAGWHILQFQYTLARGGLWGKSLGEALWANSYLPLSHSDSAFASLTESVGFFGSFLVIAGFCSLAYLAYILSSKSGDCVGRIFIISMGAVFTVQALIHISVNVTLIPPTGITLPLMSYGGSSLVSSMFAFGIILSASKEGFSKASQLPPDSE